VVAEYSTAGVLAQYNHGYRLVSRTNTVGDSDWYAFDAIGSTSELTDNGGTAVVNSYLYDPFGNLLGGTESIPNPFQYAGGYGVMREANGLEFMRWRYCSSAIGAFASDDPFRVPGVSNRVYVANNPVSFIDPLGLREVFVRVRMRPFQGPGGALFLLGGVPHHRQFFVYDTASSKKPLYDFGLLVTPDRSKGYWGTLESGKSPTVGWYVAPEESSLPYFPLRTIGKVDEELFLRAATTVATKYEVFGYGFETLHGYPSIDCWSYVWDVMEEYYHLESTVSASGTPEDKFGPAGYDTSGTSAGSEARFISGESGQPLPYRIDFWNDPDATVPTQDAIIVDELDPNVFDVDTFQFTRFGFLKWDEPLEGVQEIDTRVDLRPDMNLAVEVRAGLGTQIPGFAANDQINENTLVWWFHTVDPLTGQYPEDPMAGFLPPFNEETEYELGWVEFTVQLNDGLPTGTEVSNLAYVEFDFLQDLYAHPAPKKDPDAETPEPWPWTNTIDAGIPEDASQVQRLPATTTSTDFAVQWSGEDDQNGSGIGTYDIYISIDDGQFQPWREAITATSDTYSGQIGHTYAFYSIATDNVGHREPAPSPLVPDAKTFVGQNAWHNYLSPCNVDGQGDVVALDVLTLINDINSKGSRQLPVPPSPDDQPPPYLDVNDDGEITPLDVLDVINYINSQPGGGEGEAVAVVPSAIVLEPVVQASPNALADRWLSRWDTGQSDMLSLSQANGPAPWSAHSVRHSLTNDGTRTGTVPFLLHKNWNSPLPSPDLRLSNDLDTDLMYLDSILPDIAEDIDSAWQRL